MDIFQIIRCDSPADILRSLSSVDVNILNDDKENLLHEAIAHNPQVAHELIDRNINLNQQTRKGSTPLHYAATHQQYEIAKKIIEKGCQINLVDIHGNNPLWYAVFFAKGYYDLVQLLMKHGADPHHKNKAGRSALDFATQIKDSELIQILNRAD
ncbi:ankyrin repeat domain-containing protein [Anaerohalosphaeraceae bacterium U12dextr]